MALNGQHAGRVGRAAAATVLALAVVLVVVLVVGLVPAGVPLRAAPRRVDLLVSAAASLTDVLKAVSDAFEAEHPEVNVQLNMGSSGNLQRQIEQGAPVDVFISVSQAVTDALVRQHLIDGASVRVMASNVVVLVRPGAAGAPVRLTGWEDLRTPAVVRRLALGDPAHVPAGQYGRETLQALGLWEAVQPRLVLGEDVRQVLAYVAAGEVDAGIVYSTDAAVAPQVEVVAAAPEGSHRPVVYPVGILTHALHPEQARLFASFLFSDRARQLLQRYGFTPPPSSAAAP